MGDATKARRRPDDRIVIGHAGMGDADDVAQLFDGYRVFYEQASSLEAARTFIAARLSRRDSTILLARDRKTKTALGFVQLYPSYSSVSMRAIWILNDLFVDPRARGRGVGRRLMEAARDFARKSGALRLELATAKTNATAQRLYHAVGYVEDEVFLRFSLTVD